MTETMNTLAAVNMLIDAYPRADIKAGTAKVYVQFLADIPVEALAAAVSDHITRSKWFPSVAEIREAALKLSTDTPQIPTAGEAWALIESKLGNRDCEPTWPHPIMGRALKATASWFALNTQPMDTLKFERIRFEKVYAELYAQEMDRATRAPQTERLLEGVERPALTGAAQE